MGTRGPAPTAKRDLARKGSTRALSREEDMELPPGTPQPPDDLDEVALAEWHRVVPQLAAKGVLTESDRAALIVMCQSWSMYDRMSKAIESHVMADLSEGISMDGRRLIASATEAARQWRDMAIRFGLTPADRPRVKLPEQEKPTGKDRFKPRLAN